ncbi:ubiquinol-cytochrome c reductase iron-sulfur subunit [Acidihalobacter ferrooxydans]|uniref:Ubiquinol-cytochrome c reductase iron-sulfur subunit n=1 Tax=Acidihalobacter ferrooxydans TaxID=1765967 RepID=A0A1P8UGC3_9GAMM|nr:ubiquinol-cytochrome c reductase iron-sulfur subunit [Acidihalobacter ferrooxydans]APZ42893.1 ubiquinol-cytochrome c reductase iron-sulfur subunit [Acidihalobacter ferrooxydans]
MCERFAKETDDERTERRRFLKTASALLGATVAAPMVARAAPQPKVVDISHIPLDGLGTVDFEGKPVVILHRSKQTIATLERDQSGLADPGSHSSQQPKFADNPYRSKVPEWLVMVNICTHAGCHTNYQQRMESGAGGFFCPCHGSRFDAAGRVFRNQPAPWNMEIPEYAIDTQKKQVQLIHADRVRRLY